MPAQLRSPRTFCLACGCRICPERLRAENITLNLFGFCSSVCEINYGVWLSKTEHRVLPKPQQQLLAEIQAQLESGAQVAQVKAEDQETLRALARKQLVVLRGRLGAVPTVRGDISFVRSQVLLNEEMGAILSQDPRDSEDATWYREHGHGEPVLHD